MARFRQRLAGAGHHVADRIPEGQQGENQSGAQQGHHDCVFEEPLSPLAGSPETASVTEDEEGRPDVGPSHLMATLSE